MDLYQALMAQTANKLGSGSGMPGAPANSSAPSQGGGLSSEPPPLDINSALAQNAPQPGPTPSNPFQGMINQGSAGKDKAVIDSINAGGLGKMRS